MHGVPFQPPFWSEMCPHYRGVRQWDCMNFDIFGMKRTICNREVFVRRGSIVVRGTIKNKIKGSPTCILDRFLYADLLFVKPGSGFVICIHLMIQKILNMIVLFRWHDSWVAGEQTFRPVWLDVLEAWYRKTAFQVGLRTLSCKVQ